MWVKSFTSNAGEGRPRDFCTEVSGASVRTKHTPQPGGAWKEKKEKKGKKRKNAIFFLKR